MQDTTESYRWAALRRHPVILFAGLGLVSGALSIPLINMLTMEWLGSPLVGLVFGVAICLALYGTATPKWRSLAIAFLAIQLTWQAGQHTAYYVHDRLTPLGSSQPGIKYWRMIPPGLTAGAVGAAGTWLGAAFCAAALRTRAAGALAVFTGIVAGLATVLGPFALFPIWQIAVAASLGVSIAARGNGTRS